MVMWMLWVSCKYIHVNIVMIMSIKQNTQLAHWRAVGNTAEEKQQPGSLEICATQVSCAAEWIESFLAYISVSKCVYSVCYNRRRWCWQKWKITADDGLTPTNHPTTQYPFGWAQMDWINTLDVTETSGIHRMQPQILIVKLDCIQDEVPVRL